MKRPIWLLAILSVFGLGGCAMQVADTPASCAFTKLADMPVTWVIGTPRVQVSLGGTPLVMMLDTGAVFTALSKSVAARLDLPQGDGGRYVIIGVGGQGQTRPALVHHLALGGGDLGRRSLQVLPYDMQQGPHELLDGAVGMDVLSDYDIDLDLPHNRVALYRKRNCPSGRPDWGDLPGAPLRSSLTTDQHMTMPVTVNGHVFAAVLDSGATISTIDVQAAGLAGAKAEDLAHDRTITSYGFSKEANLMRLHAFDDVQIGPTHNRRIVMGVTYLPAGTSMLLGENFLRQHRVWIAIYTQQVFVSPTIAPMRTASEAR